MFDPRAPGEPFGGNHRDRRPAESLICNHRSWPACRRREKEVQVPSDGLEDQATLFSRIVQFDRTFDARSVEGLVVAILFQEAFPASVSAGDGFSRALRASGFLDAKGPPPRIVEVRLEDDLGAALESAGVDLSYMAPG